jgi:acyl-CoA dehydrogenase
VDVTVPAPIRPLRDRVLRFVEDRIYPVEAILERGKVAGAAMLHNVIDRAVQVHGAMGVSGDTPLERMYRAARSARILDGPDEVHKQRVARLMLKPYRAGRPASN